VFNSPSNGVGEEEEEKEVEGEVRARERKSLGDKREQISTAISQGKPRSSNSAIPATSFQNIIILLILLTYIKTYSTGSC